MKAPNTKLLALEICILAGGLSSRMGRDKSRLRLGQRTMLGHIRTTARSLDFKVRTIRRDSVARCGPIGGIYTALKSSQADSVLILACDMPFVPAPFLQKLLHKRRPADKAIFACEKQLAGFPCLFQREACLPFISRQIERGEFSLQKLARLLRARMVRPPANAAEDLANINTPAELKAARQQIRD
jgi:molybdopterin-guanine dinucleotide biosynthesis protein A